MSNFPYILTDKTCTVFVEGRALQTDRSNPNWDAIKVLINNPDAIADEFKFLMTPIHTIIGLTADVAELTVANDTVFYGDEELHYTLATRMLDVLSEGLNLDPWKKFVQNVFANPFVAARNELYLWLEKADLPITPDGCFIAYKVVRSDYTDCHTGTFDNSIGKLVVMPGGRDAVDPNRDVTCSTGLHFCSKSYLPSFGTSVGNRVVLVKINPADVVSIPSDYDNAKGRTWRYEVVGEITREEAGLAEWNAVQASYEDYSWGYDDDAWDDDFDDSDWDAYVAEYTALLDAEEATVTVPDPIVAAYVATPRPGPAPLPFTCYEPEADEPFVDTVAHGKITKTGFLAAVASLGSLKAVAKYLGASEGTIQYYKKKLVG